MDEIYGHPPLLKIFWIFAGNREETERKNLITQQVN